MKYYLAIDIGASSGRHIIGWQENGQLKTDEVFRFDGYAKKQNKHFVWDLDVLVDCVIKGIAKAFAKYPQIESLAIDTWGVDYVLMDGKREILPCLSYRDNRTESVIDKVHGIVPFAELYAHTGIQFQSFNTIYQLFDDKLRGRLQMATDFLMIPEYLAYRLTGNKAKEYTNATTTGLVNAQTGSWDGDIIRKLGFDEKLFGKLFKVGTTVGYLQESVSSQVGGQTKVVQCATHDTASAVEGIEMENQLYISSGTWSLLGVKTEHALTDENSRIANYSNEGGVGYNRYQKNIMGMWVVNELRRELCPDKPFAEIVEEAQTSDFTQTVDVNHADFFAPQSMVATFNKHLQTNGLKIANYFNCAFLSLAESYRQAIAELERNVGKTYSQLYIVGGGAKNAYLNKLTEQATGKQVIALPIEATALGNLKIQMEI